MEGCCTTNQGQLLLTMAKGAEAPAAAQAAARAAYETRKGGLEDRRIEQWSRHYDPQRLARNRPLDPSSAGGAHK